MTDSTIPNDYESLVAAYKALEMDCDSYKALLGGHRDEIQKLKKMVSELTSIIDADDANRDFHNLLRKNAADIVVAEREMKLFLEQMAENGGVIYDHLAQMARQTVEKMDEMIIDNEAKAVQSLDDTLKSHARRSQIEEENEFLKYELKSARDVLAIREAEMEHFMSTSATETRNDSSLDELDAKYEERIQQLERSVNTNITRMSSSAGASQDLLGNDKIASLSRKLTFTQLSLGVITPEVALENLVNNGGGEAYDLGVLQSLYKTNLKKPKKSPMRSLRKIFSMKKSKADRPVVIADEMVS